VKQERDWRPRETNGTVTILGVIYKEEKERLMWRHIYYLSCPIITALIDVYHFFYLMWEAFSATELLEFELCPLSGILEAREHNVS
jgi:hypothetical protein